MVVVGVVGVVSNMQREDFDGLYFHVCIYEPLTSAICIWYICDYRF